METLDTSPIVAKLDQLIAVLSQPPIPPEKRLWTRSQVGEYLQLKASTLDKVLSLPSFPSARVAGNSHPRYVAGEVMAWMEKQRR